MLLQFWYIYFNCRSIDCTTVVDGMLIMQVYQTIDGCAVSLNITIVAFQFCSSILWDVVILVEDKFQLPHTYWIEAVLKSFDNVLLQWVISKKVLHASCLCAFSGSPYFGNFSGRLDTSASIHRLSFHNSMTNEPTSDALPYSWWVYAYHMSCRYILGCFVFLWHYERRYLHENLWLHDGVLFCAAEAL